MKLTAYLGLLIMLISATSEAFAQNYINQLYIEKQIHESKLRQIKAFNPWVFKYYSLELKVAEDQIINEHYDQFVKNLEQAGATKEDISRALDKEKDDIANRATLDLMNELKGWFRRDFPNTPWGQLPR